MTTLPAAPAPPGREGFVTGSYHFHRELAPRGATGDARPAPHDDMPAAARHA
jgi:hypothetical protein